VLGGETERVVYENREFLPPELLARMRRFLRALEDAQYIARVPGMEKMELANVVVALRNYANAFRKHEKKWFVLYDVAVIEKGRR
jgi:hypothetical protein